MAGGKRILDAMGRVLLDSMGRVMLTAPDDTNCCCGPTCDSWCSNCPDGESPLTFTVTIAGVTNCGCVPTSDGFPPGVPSAQSFNSINGTWTFTRDPDNLCQWLCTFTGQNVVSYTDGSCTTVDKTQTDFLGVLSFDGTTWRLAIQGGFPGPSGPEVYLFNGGTVQACDSTSSITINSFYDTPCVGLGAFGNQVMYGGTAVLTPHCTS